LVIVLATLGFCFIVATVSVLPSFVSSSIDKNLVWEKLEMQKQETMIPVNSDSLALIEGLDRQLKIIEKAQQKKYLISQKIIKEVISKKMSDIKINRIIYENNSPDSRKVSIYGRAPNRERLLMFRRTLEEDVVFKEVDLPISNFVRGSNIEFYLSIIPF
jgi:hypothetical protein